LVFANLLNRLSGSPFFVGTGAAFSAARADTEANRFSE
jgi:hypothetical protein